MKACVPNLIIVCVFILPGGCTRDVVHLEAGSCPDVSLHGNGDSDADTENRGDAGSPFIEDDTGLGGDEVGVGGEEPCLGGAADGGLAGEGGDVCPPSDETDIYQVPIPEGNLIENPSAEEGVGKHPAGWRFVDWGNLEAQGQWVEGIASHGTRSLRTGVIAAAGEGGAWWEFDGISISPGAWYEYQAALKSDGRVRLIWRCAGEANSFFNIDQFHGSSRWSLGRSRIPVPATMHECLTSVFLNLDRQGWVYSDAHSLVPVSPVALDEPMVSITFDDGFSSTFLLATPELDLRGMAATHFLVGDYLDDPEGVYLTRDQVVALAGSPVGHEIGSHTRSHALLTLLEDDEMITEELEGNVSVLESIIGPQVAGIAYPFGDFDERIDRLTRSVHGYARTSLFGLNEADVDNFRIRVVPVTTNTSTAFLKMWLDEAIRSKTWVVLVFHDLAPLNELNENNPYRTGIEQFIDVLDFIVDAEMRVVTVRDGVGVLQSGVMEQE